MAELARYALIVAITASVVQLGRAQAQLAALDLARRDHRGRSPGITGPHAT
jgi:hypothetical protein